jgi:beta-xylosidase
MLRDFSLIIGLMFTLLPGIFFRSGEFRAEGATCDQLGWFPDTFGVKDHSIFYYSGFYYGIANYLPGEKVFAYARSKNLCEWEELAPVLANRKNDKWDQRGIWSPFVLEDGGRYYLYFTGVSEEFTQSIILASTEDPSAPESWEVNGLIFQPNHPGMLWEEGVWADCRDPMVIRIGEVYHLYYTGADESGGIVGMATSNSPTGPWTDWGGIIKPLPGGGLPESPLLTVFDGRYYLFYNDTGQGEVMSIGGSQAGPWSVARRFSPGWAHEIWRDQSGSWMTSYLTDYSITISPLTWDDFFSPPQPFIGTEIYHQVLPAIQR